MKYRTKLYISLVGVALASIILGLVIFSTEAEKLVFKMMRSRAVSIAATVASQLDPATVKQSIQRVSEKDPAYQSVLDNLRKALDANRREDLYIADLSILYPDPENPNALLFNVETDPDPALPGAVYSDTDKDLILKNKDKYFSDPSFVTDQYGVWLSGFAPIRDANGNYVATLSVDINAADIHMQLEELIKFAIWGLLSSLLLAIGIAYFLSKKVTIALHHLCDVVEDIEEGKLETRSTLESNDEFGELSNRINAMSRGLQERERLKMSFARYVSTHIMEKIIQSEAPLKLEGERRKVTLLFSDIRQFTLLAEKLPPEEVVHLLNQYFEQMIEVIFSHSGTLDKFIGDGVMAEFGAPLDDEFQEEHAIRAAIAMQKALMLLSKKCEAEGKPRSQMGIGVHT
ncbi:MAG: Adenylate cyclase 2, partial [Chlamydiae bacterium]|nr:Adenylate cyclase 2 [Chlamydiota bacterium]